ncbi:glycosyl transferase family 2 [Thiocapsa imhoffii]|uniref:Glycosyl transferase family 2 n=1 Tax=Thiocapsa imhoffii TaxID=382777 RepID=A0A9X0WGM3_9GAMM|nr:glycosyltransferase [Thiocapsa imhoffii]MBK1643822.1 glycosyl transferase family 2 [Thiocapsa imhoffii]
MNASVIIPTLNEAKLLPGLLDRLARQTCQDFETIVADAGSTDGTREICREHGVILTTGGMPAVGRNRGAAMARGERLFFFDADVLPPEDFMEQALAEMATQGLRLATCRFTPDSDHPLDQLLFELANQFVKLSLEVDPHAGGFAIFVDRDLFEMVGGFNESLRLAEDHDFVRRAARHAPLGMLESTQIKMSVRRLEKDGRFSYSAKCIRVELHRLFKGEVTEDIVDYQFGYDQPNPSTRPDETLERLIARMEDWRREYAAMLKRLSNDVKRSPEVHEAMTDLRGRFDQLKDAVRAYVTRR